MGSNVEKLKAAGLIYGPLPKAHETVLDGLSDDELDVILEVANRLAQADQQEGISGRPAYTAFMTF